ncbi:hypothetical protein U8527_10150 [Kordia algicida OT-1]|uniref:Uncharacterized protein n=1 Tax=Kordia algicida OT-1 TaxID=391587 RepID=A9DVT4_9FLAO|nr:hypothetical protein [Kordia algicida]EDP96464.1 hypothetical protein KAOT1_03607 [Kordia algicida OT-1]
MMENKNQIQETTEQLLETHVTLEKLKLLRKDLVKEAFTFVGIALLVIIIGWIARAMQWTEFPILPGAITLCAILLALGLRPLQNYKENVASAKTKQLGLEASLKEAHITYEIDVHVTKNFKGEFDVQKSIKLVTSKAQLTKNKNIL